MATFQIFSASAGIKNGYLSYIKENCSVYDKLAFNQSGSLMGRHPADIFINNSLWSSEDNENFGQWIEIELINSFIDISAYGIGHDGNNYPRAFEFSVSFDGEIWKVLHNHTESDDLQNITGRIYPVDRVNARFFKWTNRGNNGNPNTSSIFYIKYLDLFGAVVDCDPKFGCSFYPHIQPNTVNCQLFKLKPFLLFTIFL